MSQRQCMKKNEIEPFDIQRILFGQNPGEFVLEVLFRTLIIYLFLLLILRLMGKRMDGQLTITEFAVMVMLGAVVSVPMQIAERGLLLGIISLLCILLLHRSINWLAVRRSKLEEITHGTMTVLVKNGILQLGELHRTGMSKQNLFAALRARQIFNLGKVRRVYFEACGLISVYTYENKRPGLPIYPDQEMEFMKERSELVRSNAACSNCGRVVQGAEQERECKNCGVNHWTDAVY